MDQVEFFKGCLPQILLGPLLNTLCHIIEENCCFFEKKKLHVLEQIVNLNFVKIDNVVNLPHIFNFKKTKETIPLPLCFRYPVNP